MSDEKLDELKKAIRERLREGMARVERLEETTDQQSLDKWIAGETKRYGGRAVELEDES